MFPFDVILFDVGGVLLTNGWDHVERARVIDYFHLDLAGFEARNTLHYDAWERNAIPIKTYLERTVFFEPRSFSQDEFFSVMLAQSQPLDDGALGILSELAASQKCLVGALNNEARETNEYRFKKFGLNQLFQVALSSCYLGLRKPEPAIYRRALDILRKPAERILFIDDREENVTAAQSAGMRTIRFHGSASLRSELSSLGVI